MLHLRALWAVGATLLAFASEGLQGVMSSAIGNVGAQVGVIGAAVLSYVFIEVFAQQPKPPSKRRRKPVAKPKPQRPLPKRKQP